MEALGLQVYWRASSDGLKAARESRMETAGSAHGPPIVQNDIKLPRWHTHQGQTRGASITLNGLHRNAMFGPPVFGCCRSARLAVSSAAFSSASTCLKPLRGA